MRCAFPDCPKLVSCRGYCDGHYQQVRDGRALSPLRVQRKRGMSLEELVGQHLQTCSQHESGCLIHPGPSNRYGYVKATFEGKVRYLHELLALQFHGERPEGQVIRHTCGNGSCLNPDHVGYGTQSENMVDMARQGRVRRQKLDAAKVRAMRLLRKSGMTFRRIGKEFGCSESLTRQAVVGKTYFWVT